MKILVTGAAGFIGHHVARRLAEQGHQVVGIDNLNPYYEVRLKLDRLRELGIELGDTGGPDARMIEAKGSSLQFQRMDLVEAERLCALFAEQKFELVYHLAAQAGRPLLAVRPVGVRGQQRHRIPEHSGSGCARTRSAIWCTRRPARSTAWTGCSRSGRPARPTIRSACTPHRSARTS